jgi:hypothetical protein
MYVYGCYATGTELGRAHTERAYLAAIVTTGGCTVLDACWQAWAHVRGDARARAKWRWAGARGAVRTWR